MPLGFTLLRPGLTAGSLRTVMGGRLLRAPGTPIAPPPASAAPMAPGYEFIGGQNTPTVADIGRAAPPEAPPAPQEESLLARVLAWPKENPGKAIAIVALLIAAYTAAYKLGKRRKNRRGRR